MSNWVEDALNETMDWIEEGAAVLKLYPKLRVELMDRYRADYAKHNEDKWKKDKVVIEPLAETVGILATSGTFGKWLTAPWLASDQLDRDETLKAAGIVAAFWCPLKIGPTGQYCEGFRQLVLGGEHRERILRQLAG